MKAATRVARNASARVRWLTQQRAERWVAAFGATVRPYDHFGQLRYRAEVGGFWPENAPSYALAVEALKWNVEHRCRAGSPTAPRGRSMGPIRAAQTAWEAAGGG